MSFAPVACPHCKYNITKSIKSQRYRTYYRRWRKCIKCERTFITHEIYENEGKFLNEVKYAIKRNLK